MPHTELSITVATALAFLLAAGCGIVAFLYYRRTIPPIPIHIRTALTLLRTSSLFLVALLLLEPLMHITRVSTETPLIAVAVDNSLSMTLRDNAGNRGQILREAARRIESITLPSDGEQRFFLFGRNLRPLSGSLEDSLTLKDAGTDISGSLRELSSLKNRQNLRAVILLTDGSFNLGENPLYTASDIGMPVFTVGIGDSTPPRDVTLTKVLTNDLVYEHSSVPVDATIRASGFSGEVIDVLLEQGGTILDRKRLRLQPGTQDYVVSLSYTAEGEGVKKFRVRASETAGELTTQNNSATFTARILKGKVRILIVSGGPSSDLAILKQTITEQSSFRVDARTQKPPSGFYEGPLTAALIDSADCLMLVGFPTGATSIGDLSLLHSAISDAHTPVFFLAGRFLDQSKLDRLGSDLPFSMVSSSTAEEIVSLDAAQAYRTHPLLISGSAGFETWKRLPPIFRTRSVFRARPEAILLGSAMVQNTNLDQPLFVIRNVNGRRAVAILGYGIWRWRLMAQNDAILEDFFPLFITDCLRWLTAPDESRSFVVKTTRDSYLQGDAVQFTGQVYDALARPIDAADIQVRVSKGEQVYQTSMTSVGNGRYEGVIDGLPDGEYSYIASAAIERATPQEYRGRFAVGELQLEFLDARMNASLLRQLATRTGGMFVLPGQIDSLATALHDLPGFVPREVRQTDDIELWNWTYTLSLIILLFGVEWFLRKRFGMV